MGSINAFEKSTFGGQPPGKISASLSEKLQTVKWGKYKTNELFKLQKITKMLTKEDLSDKFHFPAYSSESTNNGIIGYTDSPEFICNDKHPVFITFGDHTRSFNIATESFSVLDNVKVLLPSIQNLRCLLWIITAWQKQIPNLGYARHWKVAKNCIVELPTKDGKIDFDFMESFIAELETERIVELEAERIAELSAYLTVGGFDNYELSDKELKILQDYENGNIQLKSTSFCSIFNKIKQGRRLKKDDQLPGKIPFVMSGTTNTGVVGYISNPVASFRRNSITVDIFGNSFYRNYDFGAGDDTGVYWNDEIEYSKFTMLYFTATMQKTLDGKFSYGKKLRSSQSYNFMMKLPFKNGNPDFETMDTLISAIQKLVIKDVVDCSSAKIEATKTIVSNNS